VNKLIEYHTFCVLFWTNFLQRAPIPGGMWGNLRKNVQDSDGESTFPHVTELLPAFLLRSARNAPSIGAEHKHAEDWEFARVRIGLPLSGERRSSRVSSSLNTLRLASLNPRLLRNSGANMFSLLSGRNTCSRRLSLRLTHTPCHLLGPGYNERMGLSSRRGDLSTALAASLFRRQRIARWIRVWKRWSNG
jgi:hypothetical protein